MMYIDEFNRMEQELKNRNVDSYMIADPIKRAEKLTNTIYASVQNRDML